MTDQEVRIRIAQGEDSRTQFKVGPIGVTKLAAELAAFTNSSGGIIVFGVDDNGVVIGLERSQVKTLDSEISNASNDNVRPAVYPQTEYHTIDGKLILVVHVLEGVAKPYSDKTGCFWVKAGPDKRRVTAREELQRILQKSSLLCADEMPVSGSSWDDLNLSHVVAFLDNNYGIHQSESLADDGLVAKKVLGNLGLINNGVLTLAGLLLFGRNPQRFRRVDVVKCVRFPGNDLSDVSYLDSQDFSGTIQEMYRDTMAFLDRSMRHEQAGQDFNSIGMPPVPMLALEEYVVNMLLHRDYFVSSAWKVFVFQNRIELISPGSLPDNLTIEQMTSGVSVPRNAVLFSLAIKDGIPYRGIGSGVSRAVRLHPDVDFVNDDAGFYLKTVIWIQRVDIEEKTRVLGSGNVKTLSNTLDIHVDFEDKIKTLPPTVRMKVLKVWKAVGTKDYFKRADAIAATGLSKASCSLLLNHMAELNLTEPVKSHGKGAYRFVTS